MSENEEKQKLRGSEASYIVDKKKKKFKVDLVELAKKYSNWGEVPKNVGDIKAQEIALLARGYLNFYNAAAKIAKIKPKPAPVPARHKDKK